MKIYCFAGPNGSGKSTTMEKYIFINALKDLPLVNADIYANMFFSDIQDEKVKNKLAADFADDRRKEFLYKQQDFIFESVLSDATSEHSKLKFLQTAKECGAEINTVYMLTRDSSINIERVKQRVLEGGHNVSEEKIVSRYNKCLDIFPEVIALSNNAIVYDNSLDFNTQLLMYKNNNDAVVFSNDATNDEFLQQNIIEPLEDKNINIICAESPKNVDMYSNNDLNDYVSELITETDSHSIKK